MDRRQFTVAGLIALSRVVSQQSCEAPPSNKPKTNFKGSDISPRVHKIVVEQLGVEPGKVVDTARFVEDLGADSLDVVELVMAFEEAFDIEIPDEEAEKIKTVGDTVRVVTDHLRSEKRLTGETSSLTNRRSLAV